MFHGTGPLPADYGCCCGSLGGGGCPVHGYGYGQTEELVPVPQGAATSEADPTKFYLETGLDLLAQYRMETKDPRKQVALLQAKLQNYEYLKSRNPSVAALYDMQIRKLQAKLEAAEQQLQIRTEGEAATRQWRGLGQAATGIGIIVGIGLISLTVAGSIYLAKRA